MAARLQKYQMQSFDNWAGFQPSELINKYWIGNYFNCDKDGSEKFIHRLLDYNVGPGLESILEKYPTKEFDPNVPITWNIMGSSYRNIPLKEARDFDGNVIDEDYQGNVGIGLEPFYLVFREKWFFLGETIVGNLNEEYQFRIIDQPREEGTDYVYKVELGGGNTTGVPPKRLLCGEKFSVEAAYVERELSREVGDIRFSRPSGMSNEWSTIRIQHKVGGEAINLKNKYIVAVPQKSGKGETTKVVNMWMSHVEYQLEQEFAGYRNRALIFGRSNRSDNGEYLTKGVSGLSIKTGAGLLEQLSVSSSHYYNDPNSVMKLIMEAVRDYSAKLPIQQRKWIINCGLNGAELFHKYMKENFGTFMPFNFTGDNLGIVKKINNSLHDTSLSVGGQFVEYRGLNGITITINVEPFYDDDVRNKIDMPGLGGKAMSYRFDLMWAGSKEQPNIVRAKIKGEPELRGYQWGFRNPFTGELNNNNMSYSEDSAVFHRMATLGIIVYDPTQSISFIPSILQG